MRVLFLTQEDPLYILPFFQSFFGQVDTRVTIVGVYACRSMGKRKRTQMFRELLGLYRFRGFAKLLTLQLRARLQGALGSTPNGSMRRICASRQIPYRRIGDPNDTSIVADLLDKRIDVLISVACPYILKQDVLSTASKTSINLHHAPLPRYKGMMPTFWQMFHHERFVGVTVHTVVKKLDEGPALLQDSLLIEPDETLHGLIQRSKRFGAGAVLTVLYQIADGTVTPLLLTQQQGSYFTFPTRADIEEFHRRKLRAI
jgi:methionyl-tRNA formyltransferase